MLLAPLGLAQAQRTAAAKPKFKAIWEPVNYKQDLALFDVYFVSKEEGWVSGAAGTVLHTKDGGNAWTARLGGDPHAEGAELKHVFFADATHGWAQSWNVLFHTTDGDSWQQVTGDIRGDVVFVSDTKGFRVYGTRLFATSDGGENWTQPFSCRASMEVNGLTQESNCDLRALQFPTPTVGYAVGEKRVTVKTEDGGDTWKVLVGPEEPNDQRVYDVFFLDANTGYEVRAGGKLKRTTDGGQTWQGVIGLFAIAGLGMLIGGFVAFQHTRRFLSTAISVPGVVTENVWHEYRSSNNNTHWAFYPRIRFRTTDGQQISFITNSGSSLPGYRVNEAVTILYDPRQPYHAYIKSFSELWLLPTILCGLGVVFCSFGTVAIIWKGIQRPQECLAGTERAPHPGGVHTRGTEQIAGSERDEPVSHCVPVVRSGQQSNAYFPQCQRLVRSY